MAQLPEDFHIPQSVKTWVDQGYYIDFEGLQIFVHTSGVGTKEEHGVLIVHGYPGSSWDFSKVAASVEKNTKVVVPDMIGFSQSESPLTGTYKENKLSFYIKHAIILNGSTLVDVIETTPGQQAALEMPDKGLDKPMPNEVFYDELGSTYGTKMKALKDELQVNVDAQVYQICAKDDDRVMGNILRYLLERKEFYDRWVGTLTSFPSAPMTVIWGLDDPVALEPMADRINAWRPQMDTFFRLKTCYVQAVLTFLKQNWVI